MREAIYKEFGCLGDSCTQLVIKQPHCETKEEGRGGTRRDEEG